MWNFIDTQSFQEIKVLFVLLCEEEFEFQPQKQACPGNWAFAGVVGQASFLQRTSDRWISEINTLAMENHVGLLGLVGDIAFNISFYFFKVWPSYTLRKHFCWSLELMLY